jgi:transcriptional regulator with XRE-family HTH domain
VATSQPAARICDSCGVRLARDNRGTRCSSCGRSSVLKPPNVPREFWDNAQLRDALATWHIGRVIYVYRTHPWHPRPLSQDAVAGWLELTQPQLSRIENGRAIEDLGKLRPYAQTLGIPRELLWFKLSDNEDVAQSAPPESSPRSRDFQNPAPAADVLEPDAAERLRYALKHPASADLVTVAHLRQQVEQLDEQYVHLPSTALLADAGQYLGQIRFLATHAARSRVRRQLLAVEAEAAILMGQLVWDASQRRDHASARLYLDQAIASARQVRDPATEGLALLRKTMIALYGEHNPRDGLALAKQTADTTGPASDVLTGLAQLHAAEAHAMLGELAPCETALAAADTTLGQVDDMDTAIELYSATQFGRMAGSCYLFLKDTRRAQGLLEETAVSLGDGSKSQAIVLGNLALALIRQGQLDTAAGRLHEAMDVIERNWGGGGLNIVFEAGRELRPWRTVSVVQDVHDRMLTLMAS